MSAIHEHGSIWKDVDPGIWTGFVNVLGLRVLAHAVEVIGEGQNQRARTAEGAEFLAMLPYDLGKAPMQTICLAGINCVLVIAS